jgi:low affinity sulfate transporter 2
MNIDMSGIASLLELQNNLASGGMEVIQWLMRIRTPSMYFSWCKFVVQISNRGPCFGFVSQLAITNPKWQVIHKLRLANFVTKMGGRVFLTVGEAVDACLGAKMAAV